MLTRLSLVLAVTGSLLVATPGPVLSAPPESILKAIEAQYVRVEPAAKKTSSAKASPTLDPAVQAWLDKADGKGLIQLSGSNPEDVRGIEAMRKIAGYPPRSDLIRKLPKSSVLKAVRGVDPVPACKTFLETHDANGMFVDAGVIVAGSDTRLTAATLQSVSLSGSTSPTPFGSIVNVLDSNRKYVTTASGQSSGDQPLLSVVAPPASGLVDKARSPQAVAIMTMYMDDGTPCEMRLVQSLLDGPKDIKVQAPNNGHASKTVLCLNRANAQPPQWPDPCDFGPFAQSKYSEGWGVVVPLQGTIVFPGTVNSKDGMIDGTLRVTAINAQNGSTCKNQDVDLGRFVLQNSSIGADKTSINWQLITSTENWKTEKGAPLFGKTCYDPHSGLAFNMTWQVKISPSSGGAPINVLAIISNTKSQGSPTTLIVPQVDVQFGCVPAGTRVTLADGGNKIIDDIAPTDLVRGPDGAAWRVTGKTQGDDLSVIEVTADNGTVGRMTLDHPVITGRDDKGRIRAVKAAQLRAGMPLLTVAGTSFVKSVERRNEAVKVFNIEVKPQDESVGNGTASVDGGFYADGLLVGDQAMQGRLDTILNAKAATAVPAAN